MRFKPAVSLAAVLVLALIITGCFGGSSGLTPGVGNRNAPEVTGESGFPADHVQDADLGDHAPGEIIVGVDSQARADEVAATLGATVERYIGLDGDGIALLRLDDATASLTDAMRSLKGTTGVRYAEANFTDYYLPVVDSEREIVTDVPRFGAASAGNIGLLDDDEEEEEPPVTFFDRFQYGPKVTKAVEAWAQDVTGEGTIIAVIDTGVASGHPDLAGKVLPGYNPGAPELGTEDEQGHGTHVAATAAGRLDFTHERGTAGIAPDAMILPLRVFNATGASSIDIAEAIVIAAFPGQAGLDGPRADVANLSLGGPLYNQAMQDAINFATDRGVVIVSSMGNSENQEISYPAAYQRVIAVAATDANDEVTDFSTWGRHTSVGAPGDFVFAATPEGWAWMSGTSMASPHVAGAAALLREVQPGITPAEVKDLLERTADATGENARKIGSGRLNIARALANDEAGTPYGTIELYLHEGGLGIMGANVVLYKGDAQVNTVRTGGAIRGMDFEGLAWFFELEPGDDYRLDISLDETLHGVSKLHQVLDIEVEADEVTVVRVGLSTEPEEADEGGDEVD